MFYKECKVMTLFFIGYILILITVYLTTTNFDLSWRLKNTLPRIYFYLLPSLMFFLFYIHWREKETIVKNEGSSIED